MKTWKMSRYTTLINGKRNDILLHNSFMGAIARLSEKDFNDIKVFLKRDKSSCMHGPSNYTYDIPNNQESILVSEKDLTNPNLKELCMQGFFIPTEINEKEQTDNIIFKERECNQLHLVIMPHENCNFRCVYCYEKFENGKISKSLIDSILKYVQRELINYNGLVVSWFGGEPLLAKDEITLISRELIKLCKDLKKTFSSNMTTNGYLLEPNVFQEMLENRITLYQVTIDGTAKTHDSLRKMKLGKTYNKIMQNLISMSKTSLDFKINIRVNYNNMIVENIDEFLDELTQFSKGDSRYDIGFHPILNWNNSKSDKHIYCDEKEVKNKKKILVDKSLEYGFKNGSIKKSLSPHGCVCYAGKESSVVIGSNGNLYKCTVAFNETSNQIGKLEANGTMALNEEKLKLWVDPQNGISNKCSNCSFSPACQSRACPFTSITNNEVQCPLSIDDYISYVNLIAYQIN